MSDKQENKTHRCGWCAGEIEHFQDDMCPSCGRCAEHCVGRSPGEAQNKHLKLKDT